MPFQTRTIFSIAIKYGTLTIEKSVQGTPSTQASTPVPTQSSVLKRTLQTRQPLDEISSNRQQRQQPDNSPSKRQRLDRTRMPPPSAFPHRTPTNEPNLPGIIVVQPVQQIPLPAIQLFLSTTTSQYPLNDVHRRVQMIDFARSGKELRYEFCQICFEGFLDASWHIVNDRRLCGRCKREHTKGAVHKFSLANDMDPGIVPAWLPTLSMIERMCLALVTPIVSVFRVGGGQWKGGRSHCINFFQDSTEIFQTLPRLPAEITVVVARKKDVNLQVCVAFSYCTID